MGCLEEARGKVLDGEKIVFFTLLCDKENGYGQDKIECKLTGVLAECFNYESGTELTVLGKLATKEYSDGTIRTGVQVAQLFEGNLFDISDESDSSRLRRIAWMYDEVTDATSEWTDEMLEVWDHANKEERAFLRGKFGTPPGRSKK